MTLDFQDGNTYTLTPQDIWRMSDVTLSDAEGQTVCAPVPEKVKALSDALADEYALDGVYAKFHNAEKTRPYIYYRVGDTGWILDRDALASDICRGAGDRNRRDRYTELRYLMVLEAGVLVL